MGYERYKWESYTDWINRIQAGVSKNIEIEPLFDMLDLHYELRFNPGGFQKNSQDCLADLVEKWLEKNIS